MKNLIEISKIVTKKKVKKIEIFDDHSLKHKNSKFNEFYEALMIGNVEEIDTFAPPRQDWIDKTDSYLRK